MAMLGCTSTLLKRLGCGLAAICIRHRQSTMLSSYTAGTALQIMKRVAYPATLNLRPFTSHKQAPHQEPAQYHLTGVLVHQGG